MSLCPGCGNEITEKCRSCGIILNNYCPFCDYKTLKQRVFYENKDNWICFLAAPYHTDGHSIILPIDKDRRTFTKDSCNYKKEENQKFKGLDDALSVTSQSLTEYYKGKNSQKGKIINLLYASVCGDESHFHFHIIPRWSDDENKWRKSKRIFKKGYLLSFLGFLELEGDETAKIERAVNGWCETKQRFEIINRFKINRTVESLKLIANRKSSR